MRGLIRGLARRCAERLPAGRFAALSDFALGFCRARFMDFAAGVKTDRYRLQE